MNFLYFLLGFGAKIITGLDDVITNIPILGAVAKTRRGQIAFSIGTLLAVAVAVLLSAYFASFIKNFPYYRIITAAVLFAFAAAIYFDIFVHKPREKAEEALLHQQEISTQRFFTLIGVGFVSSIATILDDVVVFTPLFADGWWRFVFTCAGIMAATVLEIVAVILFSKPIMRLKYKEKIVSAGLVVLGVLILFEIV